MPSRAAACEIFPALSSSTRWRYWRIASSGVTALALAPSVAMAGMGLSAASGSSMAPVIKAASVNNAARSITLASSRILPGQR